MDRQQTPPEPLGLLGFGEAGQAFAAGWRATMPDLAIRAYDVKTDDAATEPAKREDYRAAGVAGCDSPADALGAAPVAFSLVTADRALEAAEAAAAAMRPGALFFDGNSCAPTTKREAAAMLEAAGLRYVDCAIMAPVATARHRVPILLSGPHAEAAGAVCAALDMAARPVPGPVGHASSIKMLRSVMVKGIEALTLESLLAARAAGVEREVLASLDASMPGWDWAHRAAYNVERATTHGIRRAAEMAEAVRTLEDLGLPARMARATVDWQAETGALGLDPGPDDCGVRADRLLAAREDANRRKQ